MWLEDFSPNTVKKSLLRNQHPGTLHEFNEIWGYHRKQGLIGKLNDDLMSAPYIAAMARRKARIGDLGGLTGDHQWCRQGLRSGSTLGAVTGQPCTHAARLH